MSGKYRGSTSRLPRILLCNARSLWPKIDELAATLDAMRTDVAAITETWLHGGVDGSLVNIGGYTLHRRDRSGGRGGAVCLYVSHSIHSKRRSDFENPLYECMWVTSGHVVYHGV